MANTNTQKLVAPYIPWETLIEAIAHLKATAVPGRIDKSAIPSTMPPLVKGQVQSALKFLGLIDHDCKTTDALRSLVEVYETDEWLVKLKALVPKCYARIVGDLVLMDATQNLLDEKFAAAGIKGQMALKSVRFYLAALSAAGIPYSPHLAQRRKSAVPKKPTVDRPRTRKKTKIGQKNSQQDTISHDAKSGNQLPDQKSIPLSNDEIMILPKRLTMKHVASIEAMLPYLRTLTVDGGAS